MVELTPRGPVLDTHHLHSYRLCQPPYADTMYATTILAAGLASLAAAAPSFTPSSAVKENASVSHTINPGIHDHQLTSTQFDDLTALPACLLYTSPSPRDGLLSRMPSSA